MKTSKRFIPIMVVAVIAWLAWGSRSLPAEGYQVGDLARNFRLKNVDGTMVSPDDYADAKGFIVIFTCNSCPYAKMYQDRIEGLHQKYAPMGFPVIAINPNDPKRQPEDSFEKMKRRAADKGYTFPYLIDETQEVARAYGAKYTPHVFLLKRIESRLRVEYIGAIDDNYSDASKVTKTYVENAVDDLLNQRKVGHSFTKGIGCSIKWKS